MKTQTTLLYLWLALLPAPISAQISLAASETPVAKPLNLSLPRDETRAAPPPLATDGAGDPVARNLRPDTWPDTRRLPYGSGYEVRQRGGSLGAQANKRPGSRRGGMGRGR